MQSRDASTSYDEVIKVAIIGPEGSGKSCLVQRFLDASFAPADTLPTIGVDFRIHNAPVDGIRTRMHLWDTTGSPRLSKITHAYYRVAHAIVIAYDASDASDDLAQVGVWLETVREYASSTVAVVLVGTKADALTDEEQARLQTRADTLARRAGIPHVLTSAARGTGIEACFAAVAREVRSSGPRASVGRRASLGKRPYHVAVGKENESLSSSIQSASLAFYLSSCCMPWLQAATAASSSLPGECKSAPLEHAGGAVAQV